jgi:hypothetical protein
MQVVVDCEKCMAFDKPPSVFAYYPADHILPNGLIGACSSMNLATALGIGKNGGSAGNRSQGMEKDSLLLFAVISPPYSYITNRRTS